MTLGYNENGYPVYFFLGFFEEELDAHICLRDYNNKPCDLYVKKDIYNKIVQFSNIPSKLFVSDNHEKQVDMSTYTFEKVFEEFKKKYFPTAEEKEEEKRTHKKTRGKFSISNSGNLGAAFNNCKELHNKIYRDLTDLDFQDVIDKTEGCRSKLYNIQNLCKKLDKFALRNNIIEKDFAQFIEIDANAHKEETTRNEYSYEEITFLWSLEGNLIVDILLILLYSRL